MKKRVLTVLCAVLMLTVCITQAEAARVKAESEEAFHGAWRMEAVYVDGIRVGFEQLEWLAGLVYDGGSDYRVSEARLLLSEGKARLTVGSGETAKEKESKASFSEGKLTLDDPMGILGDGVSLWLCEDGSLTSEAGIRHGFLSFRVEVFMRPVEKEGT